MPDTSRQTVPPEALGNAADPAAGTGARPRGNQRQRLIDAMTECAAEEGYQSLTVAQIAAGAGVSSATFYEQFTSKEDCMTAAYLAAAELMLDRLGQAVADGEWTERALPALTRLLQAVEANPAAARVIFIESLAAGTGIYEQRRKTIRVFERRAAEFLRTRPQDPTARDLPPIALLGAVRSIVSRHLRAHSEDQLGARAPELLVWIDAYAIPAGDEAWSTSSRAQLSARAVKALVPPQASRPLPRLPRGRHKLPPSVVTRSHRTRIIHATAQVVMEKGYAEATVTDIVRAAGISRESFYKHFRDKEHAFLEAQQYPTQHILDACAEAYFASDSWPERVWHGLRTLVRMIAQNPALSHLRLVESYAAGPEAARRAEDITRAFTIFLEEGYHHTERQLPKLCSEAIGGAIFEIVQQHSARRDYAGLSRRLPQLAYIATAPFVGPQEARRTIERLISAEPGPASR